MNSNQLNKRIRQPTRPEEEPLLPVQTAHITSGGLSPAYVGVSHTQRLPKRTTKTSQKLTLFPEGTESVLPEQDPDLPHVIRSKSEKDQWFNNLERKYLPRVTAYCVANSLKMDKLLAHLRQKNHIHRAAPRRFDEVIYTPFTFSPIKDILAQQASIPDLASSTAAERENNHPATVHENDTFYDATGTDFEVNVNGVGKSIPADVSYADFAKLIAPIGEILYFDYGVIVMWGYTPEEEQQILNDLKPFQEDELDSNTTETEQFYFHYNCNTFLPLTLANCQPRIYNDIITLKSASNFMLKITISHAIAQSVKLTLFEGLIEETIESTRYVPEKMAQDGTIHLSRMAINQKIGELFIMRINVNLVSNVLDTPEIFWSEPALEPLYRAIRGYLEISQRVELLNQRVAVISDLLDMLKEHLNSSHGEQLEWIVIILIGFEILIGIITISVDLTSYWQQTKRLGI